MTPSTVCLKNDCSNLYNLVVLNLCIVFILQRRVVVVVVRDGDMAKDHVAPQAGRLPRAWTRGRVETKSCQTAIGGFIAGQSSVR